MERTIVIVDDVETCAATLEVALTGLKGVNVAVAPTASAALALLRDPARQVCAIITDLEMPRMDGFEFIRRVRADGRNAQVPIIVLSAATDPGAPQRTEALGANAYFAKPYSPSKVRRKLEQLLNADTS